MDELDTSLRKLVYDVRKSSIEACMEVVRQTDIITTDQKERLNALLHILLPNGVSS